MHPRQRMLPEENSSPSRSDGRQAEFSEAISLVRTSIGSFVQIILVCIGSGMTGLETAELLAAHGNQIVMYDTLSEIAPGDPGGLHLLLVNNDPMR